MADKEDKDTEEEDLMDDEEIKARKEENSYPGTGVSRYIEKKIIDQKYCLKCMALMQKIGQHKFVCPECGETDEFEEADEGVNC